ncbi:MAG: hypothetical protein QMD71_03410 [bacterium]|nr:hypothetical protein [bacterium]
MSHRNGTENRLDAPHKINYQGWLANAEDTAGVTGSFDMVFRLYNVPTGGSSLWEGTQTSVVVDKGIFNVYLGNVNPIPATLFTGVPFIFRFRWGVKFYLQGRS